MEKRETTNRQEQGGYRPPPKKNAIFLLYPHSLFGPRACKRILEWVWGSPPPLKKDSPLS